MTLTDDDGEINISECVRQISEEYDADVWLYSGPINDFGLGEVIQNFPSERKRSNAILVLVTNGGSANSGFQIATLF